MNDIDEFIEFVKTENIRLYAEKVKAYCESHKNCSTCGVFNGTCRFNNIPANWTLNNDFLRKD